MRQRDIHTTIRTARMSGWPSSLSDPSPRDLDEAVPFVEAACTGVDLERVEVEPAWAAGLRELDEAAADPAAGPPWRDVELVEHLLGEREHRHDRVVAGGHDSDLLVREEDFRDPASHLLVVVGQREPIGRRERRQVDVGDRVRIIVPGSPNIDVVHPRIFERAGDRGKREWLRPGFIHGC